VLPAPGPAPAAGPNPDVVPEPVSGRGQTILLVEDEDAVRIPARRMLERAGYRVVEATDGTQAVAQFATTPIDLLMTDVIMPGGMNGKQVADSLRTGHRDLPVVFMSGYSADLLARRGVDGSDAPTNLLAKPFSEEGLLAAVAAALCAPAVVGS
jgi:CheY-like chemotaxis protein